ncbi:MAG: ribonuclease H-like domain-containing protein, partial [Bacteroidetes bacterium]|nr:ribonuclease H-like domain-containing protein [Bacteroidota bacterium]
DEDSPETKYERAGIYAEFGKIICVSLGIFTFQGNTRSFRLKSIYGDNEAELLLSFIDLMKKYYDNGDRYLCAHNGKEFDYPYLARRILINGMQLPKILDLSGLKPWEIKHLDTMQLWKFGDFKSYTSLELLASVFKISTPKTDIDGSDVARVYYEDKDLQRIVEYCQRDVVTVAQILLKFKNMDALRDEEILFVD